MAFSSGDPIEYGKALADRTKSPLDVVGENVMDAFKKKTELKDKYNYELSLDKEKKRNELTLEEESAKRMFGGKEKSDFMPSEFKVGNVSYKNPKYAEEVTKTRNDLILDREVEKKKMLGAGAQAPGINAAFQTKKSAARAKALLFPDGTPKSYRADIATTKHPFFRGATIASPNAQNLAREYGIAIDMFNKQVTGLAFSKDELKQRQDEFRINLVSNPEAAFASLSRLEEASDDYLKIADPQGFYSGEGQKRADTALDASKTSNINHEELVASALAKHPSPQAKKAILAEYRKNTGREYGQ